MELLKEYWWLILILIVFAFLYVKNIKKQSEIDRNTDYCLDELGAKFYDVAINETWLVFPYLLVQQNKKKFILQSTFQNMEVVDTYGYTYIISKLIGEEYNEQILNDKGQRIPEKPPYVVYKVIPKTESPDASINVNGNNAPVNISNGDGTATQTIVNSSFSNKIEEYRDIMISHGILEEDINAVINNPNDEYVKKSFLSRYGLELAKISVNVAGVVVNLLKLFQS
ncbi:MAG: hypothetical protein RR945_11090 [Erysipelotrichaceae bacterium]